MTFLVPIDLHLAVNCPPPQPREMQALRRGAPEAGLLYRFLGRSSQAVYHLPSVSVRWVSGGTTKRSNPSKGSSASTAAGATPPSHDDHDDFWSSAASPGTSDEHDSGGPSSGVASYGASSGHGSSRRLPGGRAYQQHDASSYHDPAAASYPPPPQPAFDMSSPFHISPNRQVQVRNFEGTLLIDIRHYYREGLSGAVKPGSKGIAMTLPQYIRLKAALAAVDAKIREHGDDPGPADWPQ